MSHDLLKLCDPNAYYDQFLLNSIYPDGRPVESFRQISLQMSVADSLSGSCLVRQGGVSLTCRLEPFLAAVSDAPCIQCEVCSAPDLDKELINDIKDFIDQLVGQNAFYTRESLLTAGGRLTWLLHLHVMILNVDGPIHSALTACLTGAFMDLRLPSVTVDVDPDVPVDISKAVVSSKYSYFQLADLPVASCFMYYDPPNAKPLILCDPISALIPIIPGLIVITVGNNGRIHRIWQRGSCGDTSVLQRMIKLAVERQRIVAGTLAKAREKHQNK
ncbi:hypothetical protein AB6A40_002573 [Gnathostoma spinigerum]|uniref:Ribosomal RNA-processing protein 43 n=1 Tax=Gnathostoma spinigerum TaxID=75299 RepID=A0ABD6ECI6_9BILA